MEIDDAKAVPAAGRGRRVLGVDPGRGRRGEDDHRRRRLRQVRPEGDRRPARTRSSTEEGGKKVTYYLDQNAVSKKAHRPSASAPPRRTPRSRSRRPARSRRRTARRSSTATEDREGRLTSTLPTHRIDPRSSGGAARACPPEPSRSCRFDVLRPTVPRDSTREPPDPRRQRAGRRVLGAPRRASAHRRRPLRRPRPGGRSPRRVRVRPRRLSRRPGSTPPTTFPPAPGSTPGRSRTIPTWSPAIAAQRPLWGNDAATVRAVRDPLAVAAALAAAGLACARRSGSTRPGSRATAPGSSSRSPRRAGGGSTRCDGNRGDDPSRLRTIRSGSPGRACRPSSSARPTEARCCRASPASGSAGRARRSPTRGASAPGRSRRRDGRRIAAHRARRSRRAFGLVGLFGVDLILRDGEPWPVEVNPRYTASVEVLELALGTSAAWPSIARPATRLPLRTLGPPRRRRRVVTSGKRDRLRRRPDVVSAGVADRSTVAADDPFAVPGLARHSRTAGPRFEPGDPS